jgi:hypothetical protein
MTRNRRAEQGAAIMKIAMSFAILVIAADVAVPAAAQTTKKHTAKHPPAVQQEPQHIACTTAGCIAVPRQCGQMPGKTPGGLPTGYDVIICPPGVWPDF